HRGIDTTPEPMRRVGAHTRRRATFSFARVDGKCAFGFHRGGDKALVDVFECPVLAPAIIEALPDLRAVAATLASVRSRSEKCEGRMVVTALDHGLDIAITYGRLNLAPAIRTELSERALAAKALSLQINGDLIVQTQAPVLTVNGAQLEALSGVFLQAVSEVEQTIADLCIHATKKAKKVADLFSGIGTFTFPLARSARVYAFDSDVAAINSLSNSVKRNQGYKPIIAQHRDLFRDPLSPRELREFDVVVLNPPRAGAAEQSERLARSTVGTVAMIACNPATLARDARYLIDGGYMLRALTPIDQFLYSGHLEAVAVFQRSDASARRRAT
ncbi:MAG: methyltransferase, partial [Alphaproteobacteria bacterium]|nr:methyltransferase [Alphaproteobacteria bacterium]